MLGPDAAADLRDLQRIAEERGYSAGHSRGVAELTAAIQAAGALALQLEAIAPHETTVVAHAIAELSLAIARRVVESELHVDPTILAHAVESALGSINGSPEAHVLLHPASVDPVRNHWESTHGPGYLGKRWTFEADPSLPPGGCILRYEHGFVDAGLEAQIEEIGIALDAVIPSFRDEPAGDESADEEAGAA